MKYILIIFFSFFTISCAAVDNVDYMNVLDGQYFVSTEDANAYIFFLNQQIFGSDGTVEFFGLYNIQEDIITINIVSVIDNYSLTYASPFLTNLNGTHSFMYNNNVLNIGELEFNFQKSINLNTNM